MGFPGGSAVKNPHANAGDPGLIPGSGRSPGERKGNPFPFYQRSLVRFLADTEFTCQLFLPSQGTMN